MLDPEPVLDLCESYTCLTGIEGQFLAHARHQRKRVIVENARNTGNFRGGKECRFSGLQMNLEYRALLLYGSFHVGCREFTGLVAIKEVRVFMDVPFGAIFHR